MKVITSNRDVVYSHFDNDSKSTAKQTLAYQNQGVSPKKKVDWQKVGAGFQKAVTAAKNSGLLDLGKQALANKLGVQNATPTGLAADNTTTVVTVEKDKPMSTGVKVAIGLGIAAVLGFVIYKATKKK